MTAPLVTIAIPVHNGAEYLGQAIESALAQTYPRTEVLVVNDGSDDGGATDAVARGFGERIRYIVQENRGVSGALNTALRRMGGEVFTWLSHDDLFEPHKTARQVELHARAGRRDDVALFSDFRWIDADGGVLADERAEHAALVRSPMLAFYDGRINGCTVYAPRDLLIAIGGFDESLRHVQDYRAWRVLLRRAALVHVPELLVRVRAHEAQGSRSPEAGLETDPFWSETLAEAGEVEAALVFGGREALLRRSADFLRYRTPNRRAAEAARLQAEWTTARTPVSVLLDVGDDPDAARRSMESVLVQTHEELELILLGPRAALEALAPHRDGRVRPFVTEHAGAAARFGAAAKAASGAYLAFLQAGDLHAPDKIDVQLRAMSGSGRLFSHTSYRRAGDGEIVRSGAFGGWAYPEILGGHPIATSTVMAHRALFALGLLPAEHDAPLDLSWIEISARHALLGLDEPLAELALSPVVEAAALSARLKGHPLHGRHASDLARLDARAEERFEPVLEP